MDAIIKIGGSLANSPHLAELCKILEKISKNFQFLIVPGGGKFADIVRKFDKKFHLPNEISHKMAILAMDQYGLFLSHLMNASLLNKLKIPKTFQKKPIIFLSSEYMFKEDPLPNSWDVTSDSIAAHIAQKFNAPKLILVKNVDGIFSSDPKKNSNAKLIKKISANKLLSWNKKTCVDKFLPKILLKHKIRCYIVNGEYPKRIDEIFKGKKIICTEIF